MTSAYPLAPEVLAEKVRALAVEMGGWPSRNKVMTTFRVGAPKATDALDTLRAAGFDPTAPTPAPAAETSAESAPEVGTGPGLHLVKPAPADLAEGRTNGHRIAAEPTDTTGADLDTPAPGEETADQASSEVAPVADPGAGRRVRVPRWPILVIALGAFVSIWGGWVGLGKLAGFGPVQLLPGIADEFVINSAITLPLGVEAYAFYALWVWLAPAAARVPARARRFACWSSVAALGVGLFGQATYHLLAAAGAERAPDAVVVFVSCLPVLVLGAAAALTHLTHDALTHDSEARR
ncbi:hypothetical protein BJF90_39305 [Pseudonocardia sp. CNS-004]|nr:hypothetical protein BJF90_39305 [Pseudonocardia sp. CNS-004]